MLTSGTYYLALLHMPQADRTSVANASFHISAALKTHPDRVPADSPDRDSRTRRFQLVNDAYYALSDPSRRRQYDAQRRLFGGSRPSARPQNAANASSDSDEAFEEAEEHAPPGFGPGGGAQSAYSWAWNFFTKQTGAAGEQARQRTEQQQFGDVFEEMLREEGMAEEGTNRPTGTFWGVLGGLSGGALGFIVANVPGLVAGAVAGNRLGAVRDAKGKSVYAVFQELPQDDRARLLSQMAAKVLSHAVGV